MTRSFRPGRGHRIVGLATALVVAFTLAGSLSACTQTSASTPPPPCNTTGADPIDEFPLAAGDPHGPNGITPGSDGNLWFADGPDGKVGGAIGRITLTGAITEFKLGVPGQRPVGITTGPDKNLWFAELLGNQVASNNPQGVFLAQFPLANNPPRVPTGITTGPDKNLWFTEQGPGQIGRVCLQHPIAVATSTATPVGTPIQTATPGTPTPTVKFVAQPTSFDQTYNGTNPLPALTVSLDNTGSNVATPWSASATEQAPQPGAAESWAAASPTSGTVAAGASATLTVTPAADLCARLPNTPTTFMYHVAIHWTAGGGGVTTVTDTVHEQIPG